MLAAEADEVGEPPLDDARGLVVFAHEDLLLVSLHYRLRGRELAREAPAPDPPEPSRYARLRVRTRSPRVFMYQIRRCARHRRMKDWHFTTAARRSETRFVARRRFMIEAWICTTALSATLLCCCRR